MKVLVGNIRHNILSVLTLADSGCTFTQGPNGFDLFHTQLGAALFGYWILCELSLGSNMP